MRYVVLLRTVFLSYFLLVLSLQEVVYILTVFRLMKIHHCHKKQCHCYEGYSLDKSFLFESRCYCYPFV